MNDNSIRFCCPWCKARIKAPSQLVGRSRNCPGCSHVFTVPRCISEDAPVLVLIEGEETCSLGVAYRRSA